MEIYFYDVKVTEIISLGGKTLLILRISTPSTKPCMWTVDIMFQADVSGTPVSRGEQLSTR